MPDTLFGPIAETPTAPPREPTTEPSTMTTSQLEDVLRKHYIKPGDPRPDCAFLTEVTAPNRRNRADAIHVGLWASRGWSVDVHELKVSRADFQRELDKPEKAEAWWEHSSSFWIVAPNTAVAPPELLPHGWGLMIPGGRGNRFKQVVKAERREFQPSMALLVALMVAAGTAQQHALDRQKQVIDEQHRKVVEQVRRERLAQANPRIEHRLQLLEKLEAIIGFEIDDYDFLSDRVSVDTLGAALREVVVEKKALRKVTEVLDRLDDVGQHLRARVADAREAIAEIGTVQGEAVAS